MLSFQPSLSGQNHNKNNDSRTSSSQSINTFGGNNNHKNNSGFGFTQSNTSFTNRNVFQKRKQSFAQNLSSSDAQRPPKTTSSSSSSHALSNNLDLQFDQIIGNFGANLSQFQKFNHVPRSLPKFLIYQCPGLKASPIHQDDWDKANQQKMLDLEYSTSDVSSLFEDFQKFRDHERSVMEEKGLVDKEDTRKTLEDAISFQGSCLQMCPVYERIRRSIENDVRKYEKDDSTGKISPERAIKAFSRPAAGQPPPLPSDVRPPQILNQTLDYMINDTLNHLPESQSFIWDRTRSIRQDFTYQNYFGPEAMDCNEKIVRIHILTLHVMAKTRSEFSQQQELEQMNKALKTLSEMYAEYRSRGIKAPNEAEFRAYYLISQLRDPELDREIQSLPYDILNDERVQLVLNIRNTVQTNIIERGFQPTEDVLNLYKNFFANYSQGSIPILVSYLLEIYLNEIRFYALKSLKKSLHTKSKPYPSEYVINLLSFNDFEDLSAFCKYYSIDVVQENGNFAVDILSLKYSSHLIPDQKPLQQAFFDKFDFRVNSYKEIVESGVSNTGSIEIPSFSLPLNATQNQSSTASTTVKPGSGFSFSFPSQTNTNNNNVTISSSNNYSNNDNDNDNNINININDTNAASNDQNQALEKQRQKEEKLKEKKKLDEERANLLRKKIEEQKLEEQRRKIAEAQRLQKLEEERIQKELVAKEQRQQMIESVSQLLTKKMVQSTVSNEIKNVVSPLIEAKKAQSAKKHMILNSFSEGLFEAFVGELVYFESLEVLSDNFRKSKLKQLIIKKVSHIAKESKEKIDIKKRKREEFLEVSKNFGIPKVITKRKKLNSQNSIGDISNSTNTTTTKISNNKEKKKSVDLSAVKFDSLIDNVKTSSSLDKFEILIFTQDLSSTRSLFVRKKFGIDKQLIKTTNYDSIELKLQMTNEINPSCFNSVNLLVFNCDGVDKIREQRSLLKELINGISLNCNYKFEILIIFWELKGINKISNADILSELNLLDAKNSHETILNVEILKVDGDLQIGETLQKLINNIGFKYGLTAKGEYNMRYNNPIKKFKKPDIFNIGGSSTSIETMGDSIVNKFKKDQNDKFFKHLQNHIEASPKRNKLPKLMSNSNNKKDKLSVFNDLTNSKKSKIEVYSTPRPKSSELLQTPSFFNDSTGSNISNLSNITFANQSISTPLIISKSSYAQVVKGSIKEKPKDKKEEKIKINNNNNNINDDDNDNDEQIIPKSILELRKLAASVRERHGKK